MIINLRHTGIVVRDMEKSIKFYHDIIGLKVIKDFIEKGKYIDDILGLSGVNLRMVKLSVCDGSMIELLQYLSYPYQSTIKNIPIKHKIYDLGYSHIAFTVDDIDKEYKILLKKGVKFNSHPCISPDGYAKVAFCNDPDGMNIELVEVI